MTYRVETTIPDVPVFIGLHSIGSMVDFDCTLILDDEGELIEVEVAGRKDFIHHRLICIDRTDTDPLPAAIWREAVEHHTHNRWDHIDRAGVPSRGHEFADEKLPLSAFI